MATLLVMYGAYLCPECLGQIRFDYDPVLSKLGKYVGACYNASCERQGLHVRVKLKTIEAEELHDA